MCHFPDLLHSIGHKHMKLTFFVVDVPKYNLAVSPLVVLDVCVAHLFSRKTDTLVANTAAVNSSLGTVICLLGVTLDLAMTSQHAIWPLSLIRCKYEHALQPKRLASVK